MKRLFCTMTVAAAIFGAGLVAAQGSANQESKDAKAKSAVSINDPRAFQGYTLVSPMNSTKSYLLDMEGKVVRTWEGAGTPAITAYLLPNGNLLRPCSGEAAFSRPNGGIFPKGRIQEFTWNGEVVWDFAFQSNKDGIKGTYTHDLIKLPNGNVLAVMMVEKAAAECAAAGRKASGALMAESLIELEPKGKNDARVVWEWHVWDHLIQDNDAAKANYGKVAEHPERIDINFGGITLDNLFGKKDGAKAKVPGGFGGRAAFGVPESDWTHFNSLAYNAELDQVMISVHGFSEVWIIDHSTTTALAAGHNGGKYGKGGDLVYRWGNPQAYRAGTATEQQLFGQHNAHWIANKLPGAGHVLVFNNGLGRKDGGYSSVDELVLPVNANGHYPLKAGTAFGPDKALWAYTAPTKSDFYAGIISGAQRLANGNTLICSGTNGNVFEVTPKNEIVWKLDVAAVTGGTGGFGGKAIAIPGMGQLVPGGMVFRASRFGPGDPALAGKQLSPGKS
jgi:hypothetical protein